MIIDDDRCADPVFSADRTQLREGLIEGAGAWASGQEEVELLSAQSDAFAEERDALDRGEGGIAFDREAQQAQEDAIVLTRGSDPDASALSGTALKRHVEAKFDAAEPTQIEAFGEA